MNVVEYEVVVEQSQKMRIRKPNEKMNEMHEMSVVGWKLAWSR